MGICSSKLALKRADCPQPHVIKLLCIPMKTHHLSRRSILSSRIAPGAVSLLSAAIFAGAGCEALAQSTWTTPASGTTNWTDAIWTGGVPTSSPTTIVNFFADNTTVLDGGLAIVANQNVAAPITLNSLSLNGSGPASGGAATITIPGTGGGITFDGTTPTLNFNALNGTSGLTYALASTLTFNAATNIALNGTATSVIGNLFGSNVSLAGSGAITITAATPTTTLQLNGSTVASTYTGNVNLNSGVLQFNKNHNILGLNGSAAAVGTQTVTVANGASVIFAYGNAAYTHNQYFALNGTGNGTTAALQVNGVNFGSGQIGGLALASNSTISVNLDGSTTDGTKGLIANGLIVGTGSLTKNGNAALYLNKASAAQTLNGTPYAIFSGDVNVNAGILQLGAVNAVLGPNTSTAQTVNVTSGAGVNLNNGNGAFTQAQNFVLNGPGNSASANAALNMTNLNFGNGVIGGLAFASDATVRVALNTIGQSRAETVTRGLVGTGKLTKTGEGYLILNAGVPGSPVTWGGNSYSAFTGDVEIQAGAIQSAAVSNVLGANSGGTQRVTVFSGASMLINAGNNAWTQPQNFVLSGSGTGYAVNFGGIGALQSAGVGFGSNQIRTLLLPNDASVATTRTTGGGNIGLSATNGLAGTGTLNVGGIYGSSVGTLFINAASTAFAEFGVFSGKVVLNNGMLSINNATSLGATSASQVYLTGLGTFASGLALDQTFLSRLANGATSSGTIALGANSANNLDFTNYANLRLGSTSGATYSGTLTPAGGTYRLGGGGNTLTVSSALTVGNALAVSGGVTLTSPSNSFDGGITIAGNNTGADFAAKLNFTGGSGVLPSNVLTFSGIGGTFSYTGAAAGSSQSLGALAFNQGLGQVTSTYGTSGNTSLTFASLSARTAGATGNFTVTNGTNGTTNIIALSGQATGFVDKGIYFGGSNYAYYDAGGFLRAPVYGTDAGFVTSGAATSVASATHQQITGALSAQAGGTFTTLKISGAFGVTMASGTLTTDAILKTGANGTITGGAGVQANTAGGELVIRTDAAVDALTISTPVLDNGSSSLTKSGAGTLTLSSANTYSGGTTVAQGTLTVSSGGLADTGAVNVTGGTYNVNVNDTVAAVTLRNGIIGGTANLTATSYAVENGAVNTVLAGSSVVLTKSTGGAVMLTANNTYSGNTIIQGGALLLVHATSANPLGSSPSIIVGDTAPNSGAMLNVSGVVPGFTLASGQTLSGYGTVIGATTLANNSIINFFATSGNILGSLTTTGGSWNGLGSVSGLVTATTGTLTIGAGASLTANSGLKVTGGNLVATNSAATIKGNVNYISATNSNYVGVLAGSGKTLTLNNAATTLTLSGTNTYTGATAVVAGVLQLGAVGALGDGTNNTSGVTVSNFAALDLNSITPTASVALNLNGSTSAPTVGALTNSTGTAATWAGAVTLQSDSSIGGDSGNIVLTNTVTGSAFGLTKVGADTLTLSAAQNYATLTTSGGTTNLNAALGSGGSILNANAATNIGVSETLDALNIGDGAVVTLSALPMAPEFSSKISAAAVPEPGSIGLLLVGACGLLGRRRRQSRETIYA